MNGDRFYVALLRLYPAEFRKRYGRAMCDFHRDRVQAARHAGDRIIALWLSTVVDVVLSAAAEHLRPFVSGETVMDTLLQDIRFAFRGLRRRPSFTAIVVATIALGVGANAAIFSVVNGILLRPLPYPHAEQLFAFGHEAPTWLASEPDFVDYRREMRTLNGLAAYTRREGTLVTSDNPERISIARGSEDFFPILGTRPALGRIFSADDFNAGAPPAIVISNGLWQRGFGGDRNIIGRKINLDGAPRIVVGVMPSGFAFPTPKTDAWLPLPRFNRDKPGDRTNHYLFMLGRLRSSVTLEQAHTEANGIAQRIMLAEPDKFDPKVPLRPTLTDLGEQIVGKSRPYLLALLGAVGFVLLIACANVANLLLVRGEGRRKELALRSALGASGRRLVVQLLTESMVLALGGALLGLSLAWGAIRMLAAAALASLPRVHEVSVDWRVLAFTAGVAILTGVLVGIAPAWKGARGDPAGTLKEGGKTTGAAGSSRTARRALVVAEMALAVTMLSGAGMLLRSLWHLQNAGLGFEPHGVLTAKVSLSVREYNEERAAVFFAELLERLRAIPGVRAASVAGWLPVTGVGGLWGYRPEGGEFPEGGWPSAVPQQVAPQYFKAIGIPLIAGRDFSRDDGAGSELVAVVSRKFAEQSWPGGNAIGRTFRLGGDAPPVRVVGIVGDFRGRGFGDTPEPTMYFAYAQSAKSAYVMPRSMSLLVRADGDPLALAAVVRREVRALDRTVPVSDVRTLENVVSVSVALRKFNTILLTGFAAVALLLAGIGTYGVISYGVTQRRFEIGVRMALGAADRSVLALVMSEGLRLAALGLAIGLVASVAVGRAIRAMLVEVALFDSPSLVVTALLLIVVAATASFVPAVRALRVNPLDALRSQ